jgi:hypothetical protein
MKRSLLIAAALVLLGAGAPALPAHGKPAAATPRVTAYYFHTTQRCASCRKLEAWSHEAIDSAFAGPLRDGRLVWKVVNVEAKGNEHFVEDYGLYTKSLVLVREEGGKSSRWKNLEKIWPLLQDKKAFYKYVQDETRTMLGPGS